MAEFEDDFLPKISAAREGSGFWIDLHGETRRYFEGWERHNLAAMMEHVEPPSWGAGAFLGSDGIEQTIARITESLESLKLKGTAAEAERKLGIAIYERGANAVMDECVACIQFDVAWPDARITSLVHDRSQK